jgi:hypothetical protein
MLRPIISMRGPLRCSSHHGRKLHECNSSRRIAGPRSTACQRSVPPGFDSLLCMPPLGHTPALHQPPKLNSLHRVKPHVLLSCVTGTHRASVSMCSTPCLLCCAIRPPQAGFRCIIPPCAHSCGAPAPHGNLCRPISASSPLVQARARSSQPRLNQTPAAPIRTHSLQCFNS